MIFTIEFIPKKNRSANRIIQYLLAVYAVILLDRLFVFKIDPSILFKYGFTTNVLYFLIGPLIYTYIKRLLFYKSKNYSLSYKHYLPAIVYLVYNIFHIVLYNDMKDPGPYFKWFSFIFEILAILSISTYLYMSNSILNLFKKNERLELSFNQLITKYIRIILLCMGACMTVWLVSVLNRFVLKFWFSLAIGDMLWVLLGVQTYIVGIYSLKQPEIFKIPLPEKKLNQAIKKERLRKEEVNEIKERLTMFLEKDKGYNRQELNLSVLADEIGVSRNNLSWCLNNIYGKTFYQLINEYRIKDFLNRIEKTDYKKLTLVSIALDSGFNSKSTFYKAFKDITNLSPSEYIDKMKKS